MWPKGNRAVSDNSQSINVIGVYKNHSQFLAENGQQVPVVVAKAHTTKEIL